MKIKALAILAAIGMTFPNFSEAQTKPQKFSHGYVGSDFTPLICTPAGETFRIAATFKKQGQPDFRAIVFYQDGKTSFIVGKDYQAPTNSEEFKKVAREALDFSDDNVCKGNGVAVYEKDDKAWIVKDNRKVDLLHLPIRWATNYG